MEVAVAPKEANMILGMMRLPLEIKQMIFHLAFDASDAGDIHISLENDGEYRNRIMV
jgi:hypothetical protein